LALKPLPLNSASRVGTRTIGGLVAPGRFDSARGQDGQREASHDHEASPHTGAEVVGVDLAQPLRPAVSTELARAFIQHSQYS
jgi:hypothetical protein